MTALHISTPQLRIRTRVFFVNSPKLYPLSYCALYNRVIAPGLSNLLHSVDNGAALVFLRGDVSLMFFTNVSVRDIEHGVLVFHRTGNCRPRLDFTIFLTTVNRGMW